MPVYIDSNRNHFRGMLMCHMMSDSIAELMAMADTIGLQREWFQPNSFPHFDLSKSRRKDALKAGAIALEPRQFVRKLRELRSQEPSFMDWAYLSRDSGTLGNFFPSVGHYLISRPSFSATLCRSYVGSEPAVLTISVDELHRCGMCAEYLRAE